ncbi:efflux RND transporter periplasmic adaptor subunit [Brevundimonas sp.]|uniref:efflux RND transporter periplasmic adaptor subunit n=1 Tax=Brevundimonas sp. TaxID=1871086 RepID=UPI00391ABA59
MAQTTAAGTGDRLTKTLRGGAVALGLCALLAVAACGGHGGDDEAAEAGGGASSQTVTVAVATTQDLVRTITASGTVNAWEEVPVGAEAGGLTATAVYVDEGAYVRQGQPLVQLNDALLRAQLAQQEAAVSSAEANAERENTELGRARELRERGFLAQASLDLAISEQRAADAQLASARASLSEIRTRLNQSTIRAPVAGLVISRNVTRGQIVSTGTELFRIVRDGRLELDARVPETELGLIRAGQSATVTSDGVGSATGRVRIVTPEVDSQTRLGVARIALTGNSGLQPGMFARAAIDVGAQPAVAVPTPSVLYRENRPGVFVLGAENRVSFQPIEILSRTDQLTSVEGVAEGARVVVDGAGFLGDGDRVTVAQPARPEAAPAPAAPAQTAE